MTVRLLFLLAIKFLASSDTRRAKAAGGLADGMEMPEMVAEESEEVSSEEVRQKFFSWVAVVRISSCCAVIKRGGHRDDIPDSRGPWRLYQPGGRR